MFNHGIRNCSRVLGPGRDDIEASMREPCIFKGASNSPVATWRQLGGFDDGRVSGSESAGSGADAKDIRGIPEQVSENFKRDHIPGGLPRDYTQDDPHGLLVNDSTLPLLFDYGNTATNGCDAPSDVS